MRSQRGVAREVTIAEPVAILGGEWQNPAAFPLAGVPGFHGLARTALVGLKGPGSAVLAVFCQCSERDPVTEITLRLRDPRAEEFAFTELGGGKIALTPALDLLSSAGHFATAPVWETQPDGWQRIGAISTAKIKAIRKALRPAKARVAAPATKTGSDTKCGCGHEEGFHDPCSKCLCGKFHAAKKGAKPEKFKKRT